MAEAFVRTLKRDYVRVNPTPDPRTVIEQLPTSNEILRKASAYFAQAELGRPFRR